MPEELRKVQKSEILGDVLKQDWSRGDGDESESRDQRPYIPEQDTKR